jgi:beta-glucosidase
MNLSLWRASALALTIATMGAPALAQDHAGHAGHGAPVAPASQPWLDPKLDADARADLAVKAMTQDEKLTLVYGYFGADMKPKYTRIEGSLPGT